MANCIGLLVLAAAILVVARNPNWCQVSTAAEEAATEKLKRGEILTFDEVAHRRARHDIG